MKNYTIFAGVNGSGKTSIYNSIYYNENKYEKRSLASINPLINAKLYNLYLFNNLIN